MSTQKVFVWENNQTEIREFFRRWYGKRVFVIGRTAAEKSETVKCLKQEAASLVFFSDYSPNPKYEEVQKAIDIFNANNCDSIFAVGGGSAIDIAKCVKAFSECSGNYLEYKASDNDISLTVTPTTAGTGSEATQFAVIYFQASKYSVDYPHLIPNTVIFESALLGGLSEYQKKSALMDALCQCVESYWAIGATEESRTYAIDGIGIIIRNYKLYLQNNTRVYPLIQKAAYLSGKAINISRTTAAHALSYKLTSIYGVPHGHSVALCMRQLWPYMVEHMPKDKMPLIDSLCSVLGGGSEKKNIFEKIYTDFDFRRQYSFNKERDLAKLCANVNIQRLSNNPVVLNESVIEEFYKKILTD